MNNIFYEMIFRRKSFHFFRNVGNESISIDELNDMQSAYSDFTPLNPGIKTAIRIVPEKQTNYNRIDMGIFICFMDICLGHSGIDFDKILYPDTGEDKEYALNAKYRFD